MAFVRCLRGIGSGVEYPPETLMNLCPADGRPVEMVLDLERLRAEHPGDAWYHPDRPGVWRFGALMPLDPDHPGDRRHIVTLGEGGTPLLPYDDYPFARRAGFRLSVKDESHNPTLSFKDRGMAVVVSMARWHGLRRLAVPTQGNAGDALATYGLAAGLETAVVMPDDTPMPILGRVAALSRLHDGVHLDLVSGTIREAGARVKAAYLPEGYFQTATFQEPGWRIEGKKTLGLELAAPPQPGGRWHLPDVVVYPTGGGTGVLGMWKAFDELEALGLIDGRRPRMVCIQSRATAPLVEALKAGSADTRAPESPGATLATGLNVPYSVGHFRVLDIIRQSGGTALAVSEEVIAHEVRTTFREKGWWICPEGAACLAALEPLTDAGFIRPADHVVVFNTASLEKYLPAMRDLLRAAQGG